MFIGTWYVFSRNIWSYLKVPAMFFWGWRIVTHDIVSDLINMVPFQAKQPVHKDNYACPQNKAECMITPHICRLLPERPVVEPSCGVQRCNDERGAQAYPFKGGMPNVLVLHGGKWRGRAKCVSSNPQQPQRSPQALDQSRWSGEALEAWKSDTSQSS